MFNVNLPKQCYNGRWEDDEEGVKKSLLKHLKDVLRCVDGILR